MSTPRVLAALAASAAANVELVEALAEVLGARAVEVRLPKRSRRARKLARPSGEAPPEIKALARRTLRESHS